MKRKVVMVKKGEARSYKAGSLWIYDNEIEQVEGEFENGALVEVRDFNAYPLGIGFYNQNSKIAIRMLTKDITEEIDERFFKKRLRKAFEYRKKTVDLSSCRLIFGEADFLPGLIIDKFSDILVVQSLALGIDRFKYCILEQLQEILKEEGISIRGIYERSDAKVRELEGMKREKGFLSEPFDTKVLILENGVQYEVDIEEGQKTGFFLDQKYNRLAIQKLSKDAKVLDCFTHTGSFALNAGLAGAKSVLGVDTSGLAIEQARENANRNGLSDVVSFLQADIFSLLPELEAQGKQFDLVILDPPAFTKSKNSLKNAIRGYREINLRGMKLVKSDGFFATCSCSHFMTPELFEQTIAQAAKNAHCRLRQVEARTQSPDHPILWSADESYYLKFYIFQIIRE